MVKCFGVAIADTKLSMAKKKVQRMEDLPANIAGICYAGNHAIR